MTIFNGFTQSRDAVQEQGPVFDNTAIESIYEEIKILKVIVSSYYNSKIIGGFIRDCDTGRDSKDIDIIVKSNRAGTMCTQLLQDGWTLSSALHESLFNGTASSQPEYSDINGLLEYVIKARKGEYVLDIIVVSCETEEYIDRLPISTSIASSYYSSLVGAIVTRPADYVDSINTRQITISDERIQPAYVERMKEYYPDWVVVVDSDQ